MPTLAADRQISARAPATAQPDGVQDGQKLVDSLVAVPAQSGLRALIAADRSFDVNQFLVGARSAYGMILDAFWKGDQDELARFCAPDVLAAFKQAIAEREAAGHKLENRLVRIDSANITDARIEQGQALVSVRFEADISAVTRDAEGTLVAGSLVDAVPSIEVWTFSRDVRSSDPNWQLIETDED